MLRFRLVAYQFCFSDPFFRKVDHIITKLSVILKLTLHIVVRPLDRNLRIYHEKKIDGMAYRISSFYSLHA